MIGRVLGLVLLAQVTGATPAAPPQPVSFAAEIHPIAPDYSDPASWAARPDMDGPALLVPTGATPRAHHPAVDVFYIHPTTFRSVARWNQQIDDAETNAWTDKSVIARQASIFNGCCRIFAPRYRQASTRAFAEMQRDGAMAYDLAYRDVLRAFDWYLAHENRGRPFILAGHSQGGLFVTRLLEDRIASALLARRMVAAYAVGVGVSRGFWQDGKRGVTVCGRRDQTGCLLSWNSFVAGSDVRAFARRSEARYVSVHGDDAGKVLICSNLAGGRAATSLPGEAVDGALQSLRPASVRAHCQNGALMIDAAPALSLKPLPGGILHFYDLALFYGDLRADANRRSRAYLKAHRS